MRKTNFCDINIQKNQLKIWLNVTKGNIDDAKQLLRDVSNIGHHGNGDYELTFDQFELAYEKMPGAHLYQGDFSQGLVKKLKQEYNCEELPENIIKDVCASFQECVSKTLVKKLNTKNGSSFAPRLREVCVFLKGYSNNNNKNERKTIAL